jgi:hypothetical protein
MPSTGRRLLKWSANIVRHINYFTHKGNLTDKRRLRYHLRVWEVMVDMQDTKPIYLHGSSRLSSLRSTTPPANTTDGATKALAL